MQNSVFHKLSNVLWGLMVMAIVVLAIYVSLGRVLSTNLSTYQDDVLAVLNERVPFHIEADSLSGEWRSFTPEIVLSGLRLTGPVSDGDALDLSGGRVGLDVLDSILTRSLQVTSLQLDNLALKGELTADGRLILPGLSGGGGEIGAWLQEFLLNIEYVTLQDNSLDLVLPSGEERKFDLDLHLAREGSTRQFRASLISTRGTDIELIGRGVGNPFKPEAFTGDLYLSLDSADLGAVREILAAPPGVWAQGSLDSQVWLNWDRGEPSLDFSLKVSDAVMVPLKGDWSIPLDEMSLQASLVEQRNRWTLFVSDFVARRGDAELALPRLQLDTWGESLRVRTGELSLAPLDQLVEALDVLPEGLAAVLETLQPVGSLSTLEVSLGDVADPAANWDVEANFEGVEVQSWRGAPGVTSASGYLELSDGGGYVVLDSQRFTMDFPTVYRQPLYFDDFFGTLNLSWDSDSLLLDSGVITAEAVEGKAGALFRLNIPFSKTEVGLEMDLMVGLENSHPIHRVKYLPYTLNDNLLDWLSGALGEGDLNEAAFVWRGSLRRGASALRTVQLFLNVANTSLNYHPRWPEVRSVRGVVFIDDSHVSVWADSARLYDSVASRLSAETWLADNGQMMLALDGELTGPAADGLRVVNESLLGELVGGAFDDWQAEGNLETRLQLELNLADKTTPPVVDVHTRWSGVDLQIVPGRLPLTGLNGVLDYSSVDGFSSQDLEGVLWGEPVSAQVSQRGGISGGAIDFRNSVVEVALSTQVDLADVQDWLGIKALSLASGRTAVSGMVTVEPGQQTTLSLASDLVGVSLDLPFPWAKDVETAGDLALALPLGGERTVLSVALQDELALELDISDGAMQGASLGIGVESPPIEPARVLVTGQAPVVNVTAWLDFVDKYLLPEPGAGSPSDRPQLEAVPEGDDVAALSVTIQDMQARRLQIWDVEAADVEFSLDYDALAWEVTASTDWVEADYRQPEDGRSSLLLHTVDLDGLSTLLPLEEPLAQGAEQPVEDEPVKGERLELPAMDVEVSQLYRSGVELGHLNFKLEMDGSAVLAHDITGDLVGMTLTPETPATLLWEPEASTRLDASLKFSDIGDSLEQLGYLKFLETDSGRFNLALQWPGAPQAFSLQEAGGALALDIDKGRFLETPAGATGALKVVSILNLADVVSSLSLAHMFESGISFHSMNGEILLRDGTIQIPEIEVKGASSGFSFSGASDIASRSLEGEMVATLPVANNLPWVAALAAGLPVAAGVFVVSKVFEKQVNRLSSGVYKISGTWDEPQIVFDRIFDVASTELVRELVDPNSLLDEPSMAPQDPNAPIDPNGPAQQSQP